MSPHVYEIPTDVAVLCESCGRPVPLLLFVNSVGPKREVECPHCGDAVVLKDAW